MKGVVGLTLTFIRHWVPELNAVPETWIHEPWNMSQSLQAEAGCILGKDYPLPIVDHAEAIKIAREKLASVRKQEGFKDDAGKVYQKLGSRKKRARTKKKVTQSPQMELNF